MANYRPLLREPLTQADTVGRNGWIWDGDRMAWIAQLTHGSACARVRVLLLLRSRSIDLVARMAWLGLPQVATSYVPAGLLGIVTCQVRLRLYGLGPREKTSDKGRRPTCGLRR